MKRLLITGSRDWDDRDMIAAELYRGWYDLNGMSNRITLVSGGCPTGADKIAEDIWRIKAVPDEVEQHPAD